MSDEKQPATVPHDKKLPLKSAGKNVKKDKNKELENAETTTVNSSKDQFSEKHYPSTTMVLVSILVLVGAIFVGVAGFKQLQQISDRLLTLEQQKNVNQATIDQTNRSLRNDFSKAQTQLKQLLQQKLAVQKTASEEKWTGILQLLAATQRQINANAGRHQSDWLLAEADYLVRIASNRLLLEGDHVTALALLLRADGRIVLMDDPGLQPLREALSRDMAALRSVKRQDIVGIAIRINTLIPQLKTLSMVSFNMPEEILTVIDTQISADDDWWFSLKQSLQELSVKWFEVSDHGRQVMPLMSAESKTLLGNNVLLLLQSTQFATLRQQDELYHHSLLQLKTVLAEFYDAEDLLTAAFIDEIDLLSKLSVGINSLNTLESRLLLSRLVKQRLLPDNPDNNADIEAGEAQ